MKLRINRDVLLPHLQKLASAIERKSTMPILSNVLICASPGTVRITATNLEIELSCTIDETEVITAGSITLPFKKLFDICRTLSEKADIQLAVDSVTASIKSGKSRFTLQTLPADHFPDILPMPDQASAVALPKADLKHMLEACASAMGANDVRYYLNGMLFEMADQQFRVVATDGHRLSMATLAQPDTRRDSLQQIIVPSKTVHELSKLLDGPDNIRILFSSNHMQCTDHNICLTSKLIEGKYPEYKRVIPADGDQLVTAGTTAMKTACIRVSTLANENLNAIIMAVKDNALQLSAINEQQEHSEEEMTVEYTGDPVTAGFNAGYLIDALKAINTDQVTITIANDNKLLVQPTDNTICYRHVVMPMRI